MEVVDPTRCIGGGEKCVFEQRVSCHRDDNGSITFVKCAVWLNKLHSRIDRAQLRSEGSDLEIGSQSQRAVKSDLGSGCAAGVIQTRLAYPSIFPGHWIGTPFSFQTQAVFRNELK